VSYIEAEACAAALRKYGQDVVPPLEPSPPDVGTDGVRQAPSTVEQLQHVFCEVRAGSWQCVLAFARFPAPLFDCTPV
jgi:hypothetical protein